MKQRIKEEKTYRKQKLMLHVSRTASELDDGQMASELPVVGLSYQGSDGNRSVGISHTMSLAPHVCPSALRCCSSHTCESIQNHHGAHPKCDSTVFHAYLPTTFPLA